MNVNRQYSVFTHGVLYKKHRSNMIIKIREIEIIHISQESNKEEEITFLIEI